MKAILSKYVVRPINVLIHPINLASEIMHGNRVQRIVHSKRLLKVTIGFSIMLTGSTMATHPVEMIPHILWDAIAYGLHGYGSLPAIKLLCQYFNLEDISS